MEDRGYKEGKKEDYYEEYLTVLADLMKKGEIKQKPDLTGRLGDFFYPILRKALNSPDLGKTDFNQITQEVPNGKYYEATKINCGIQL